MWVKNLNKSTFDEINKDGLPWITFEVAGQYYGINTRNVSAIALLDDDCTDIPESKPYIRGLITFRNKPIQVLDLRTLLGHNTLKFLRDSFDETITRGKQSHLNWVSALEQSVEDGTPFQLAKDPHKCAFGQWYDNFSHDSREVSSVLHYINEPHIRLHETAEAIEKCGSDNPEQVRKLLKMAREVYVKEIIKLLDSLMGTYASNTNELILALQDGDKSIAVAVDSVVGVQTVELLADGNVKSMMSTGYSIGVARVATVSEPVLLLDDNLFLNIEKI